VDHASLYPHGPEPTQAPTIPDADGDGEIIMAYLLRFAARVTLGPQSNPARRVVVAPQLRLLTDPICNDTVTYYTCGVLVWS
jgi:hypothetical protein